MGLRPEDGEWSRKERDRLWYHRRPFIQVHKEIIHIFGSLNYKIPAKHWMRGVGAPYSDAHAHAHTHTVIFPNSDPPDQKALWAVNGHGTALSGGCKFQAFYFSLPALGSIGSGSPAKCICPVAVFNLSGSQQKAVFQQ